MSATTVPSPAARRPATVTAAMLLLVFLGLIAPILLTSIDQIPPSARLAGFAFAAVKLVAAVGLWRCKKWAAILGFAAVLLDALSTTPGLVDAPNTATVLYIIGGMGLSIVALVLLIVRSSRLAYA